jgi:quercetin dioxygenase-like cupin family protein
MQDQIKSVGDRIKCLRLERRKSVAEISSESGLPESTIEAIEDLKLSPPLGNIVSIAKALRVTLGDLFGDNADSPFCIVRSDDRKTVSRFGEAGGKSGGYQYESLGYQKQDRQMEPFLVTLAPNQQRQVAANIHDGEEILFILEGEVEISLGDYTDILKPGDSIYYDSTLPHVVSCHGDVPAKMFAVIYAKKEMIIF